MVRNLVGVKAVKFKKFGAGFGINLRGKFCEFSVLNFAVNLFDFIINFCANFVACINALNFVARAGLNFFTRENAKIFKALTGGANSANFATRIFVSNFIARKNSVNFALHSKFPHFSPRATPQITGRAR